MPPEGADLLRLEPLAKAVLDARATYLGATLAHLYDPDLMPPNLRRAHQALDRAVDRLYRCTGFGSERERVEHLFMLYERMRAPLETAARPKTRRRTRVTKELEMLIEQLQSSVQSDEPFGIAHGNWSFPAISKVDLVEDVQSVIDFIEDHVTCSPISGPV